MIKNSKSRKDKRRKSAVERFKKQLDSTKDEKKKGQIEEVIKNTEKNLGA